MGTTSAPGAALVGRRPELEAASAILRAAMADRTPRVVVLTGPAGIGKTALWRAVIEAARTDGARAIIAAPGEAEGDLAYAGLGDLVAALPDELVDRLPPPQRRAIRVATDREDPGDVPLEPRTIGIALRNVIAASAAEGPLVIAIDDVQWLDRPSTAALRFALRRLDRVPLALLVSVRVDAGDDLDALAGLRLDWLLADPDHALRIPVAPLSAGSLFQLLRAQLGHAFARPTLLRITEWSGGNPLLAVELGRSALRSGGLIGPHAAASLPRSVTDAIDARLGTLSPDEARIVLLAACAPDRRVETITKAAQALAWPLRIPGDGTVLRQSADRLELGHPLIAERVVAIASDGDVRAAHRALADLTADPVARVRHLAIAGDPGEDLGAALEVASAAAAARGAVETAIDLGSLACDVTPADAPVDLVRRRQALGELLQRAGEINRAETVFREVVATARTGPERALARIGLASVTVNTAGRAAAEALCRDAALDAAGDDLVGARVEISWSRFAKDAQEALGHARRAIDLIGPTGPIELRAVAMAGLVSSISEVGEPVPRDVLDEALRLETLAPVPRLLDGPSATEAWLSLLDDDLAVAHDRYERLRQRADDLGDESSLGRILVDLAQIDLRRGRWDELEEHATEAIKIAERAGSGRDRILALIQLGALAAARGDRASAQRDLDEARAFGRAAGHAFIEAAATGNLGTLALAEGDTQTAIDLLELASRELAASGLADMALSRFQGDALEALVQLGRLDAASRLADELEARAGRNGRRRPLALVARGRGLIDAAHGRLDDAIEELTASVEALQALDMPFEAARSRLARGIVHRRRREKRLAEEDLSAALATFEQLGATAWAERAAGERARIGLRPRAPGTLTDTERAVARLAADGLTSREIASAAFMSPRTVEGVLARVYAKLGVGSRAELGVAMAAAAAPTDEVPIRD